MSEMKGPGTPATQMFDLFAPGTMLGRNELLATIGEGGMARVILARQRGPMGFEKVVVVKVIHPDFATDRAAIGMLLDEARIAAQISHPNVVQTYELGVEVNGHPYIVMEYLAGESLQRILKSVSMGVAFDPRMAARIVADTCDGLHAAHELTDLQGNNLGLIHRDVSLGNIVVLYNGCVKVVDFGIVKTRDRVTSTTQNGQLKGKYAYMSPEQIRNEPMDRRSDVFSLGVVLWECLSLRRLFHADNVPGILVQILESKRIAPSHFRPEVPRELDAIALKALDIDPANRFQSALEMKRALEDVIWQSRCDAGDVRNYMTAVFGDRMRKRQTLLSSAARASAEIEPKDATFDDTSGLRPAPQLPRRLDPQRGERKKRNWLAGVVLGAGVMIGVGAGIRLIGGSFGRDNHANAQTLDSVKQAPKFGVELLAKHPEPVAPQPVTSLNDPTDDAVPTMKSRLRPEHLDPEFVDDPPKLDPKVALAKIETADASNTIQADPKPDDPKVDPKKDPKVDPKKDPKESGATLRDLYAKGSELFLAGSFVDAANIYKQALALDRNFAPAHRGLGFAYQRMGFDALAIESFHKYLALAPGVRDESAIRQRIEQLGGQP